MNLGFVWSGKNFLRTRSQTCFPHHGAVQDLKVIIWKPPLFFFRIRRLHRCQRWLKINEEKTAVLRISDILVGIRIQGSVPLTNGSGSCYFLLITIEGTIHLHHSSKIISHKEITKSRHQGFPYYFWSIIEGSVSAPLTNRSGSGSRRPKNIRIRRIQNTGKSVFFYTTRFFRTSFKNNLRDLDSSRHGLRKRAADPDQGSGAFWPLNPRWVKNWDPYPGWTTRIIFPKA
jgi:hypothetical protein